MGSRKLGRVITKPDVERNIFSPENHLHQEEERWFAVYTKYKTEKYVANNLDKKGIETFVPLIKHTRRYARKVKTVELPLINCYVFVKISKADYVKVLQTEYVSAFVKIKKNLLAIPEEEILTLKRVIGAEISIDAEPADMFVGEQVEVISGHLTGLKGVLVDQKGKSHFVVKLETLGYDLTMQIDKKQLRPMVGIFA